MFFDEVCNMTLHWVTYLHVFVAYLALPVPIGIIGGWRWGVWVLRRVVGMFYRPIKPNGYWTTTSVVTPVYNETPEVFRAALRSWAANGPTEIIAVIDHSDGRCMQVFREFAKEHAGTKLQLKLVVTKKPGKRPALVDGMRASMGEVVFLVDSDTIWGKDVLLNALAPFVDPKVGGVTTRQNVLAPNTVAQRLFDLYLDVRYMDEIRFLTAFGDVVTCLSGRTAVYRSKAVLPVLDALLHETFLGRPVISGDDKALTLLVQAQGWKVRYQETARVYTPGTTSMSSFLKQRLRWARNSWRADLKALGSGWTWREPVLVFHLLDRLVQPLTTLIAPLYLAYSVVERHWLAVFILFFWWFVSRAFKIWPHLRRTHWDLSILPWYVFFSYWTAIVKIYAFFTMNQQGWITRWNRNRMRLAGPLQMAPGYTFTVVTVALMAWFVNSLNYQATAHALTPGQPVALIFQQAVQPLTTDTTGLFAWPAPFCKDKPALISLPQERLIAFSGEADFTPNTAIDPQRTD